MAGMGKDFADRAVERYRSAKGRTPPAAAPPGEGSDDSEASGETDAELGKAVRAAIKSGDNSALAAAIRAICS